MDEAATVRLTGHLATSQMGGDNGRKRIDVVTIEAPVKLGDAIRKLESEYHLSLDRSSILILVNGVEANALDDLETIIGKKDNVVIVPMFHGG